MKANICCVCLCGCLLVVSVGLFWAVRKRYVDGAEGVDEWYI